MRVAIVHYHLKRGGVTRVIENAASAFGESADIVVLSGTPPDEDTLKRVLVVEGLDYRTTAKLSDGSALGARIHKAATDALGASPDLWHIHNHCLGKNVAFPGALRELLRRGARLLLQIHDFAEDGRPANYRAQRALYTDDEAFAADLYPAAPQVHYALLNARDHRILGDAGVPRERRHLLPNAISVPDLEAPTPAKPFGPDCPYFLYPTRAIRRKNVGELLLLAALAKQAGRKMAFATTLAPANPEWQAIHEEWVRFGQAQNLPVAFALGEDPKHSFSGLIHGSEALITTSIAEGFGLAFLEPFLFGKTTTGRNLPEITADFHENGISLDNLYPMLPVSLSTAGQKELHQALTGAIASTYAAYGVEAPSDAVERAFESCRADSRFDFGRLNEPLQRQVIEQVGRGNLEASLVDALPKPAPTDVISTNRERIETHYGLPAYGRKLRAIYQAVIESEASPPSSHLAHRVLEGFLAPDRFYLLRS